MNITVKVKTNAKKNELLLSPEGDWTVKLNVVPEKGQANEKIIELLAEHFQIAKSKITLLKGHKSKIKVFSVEGV